MGERAQAAAAVSMLHVVGDLDLATVPVLRRDVEQALSTRPQTLARTVRLLGLEQRLFVGQPPCPRRDAEVQ